MSSPVGRNLAFALENAVIHLLRPYRLAIYIKNLFAALVPRHSRKSQLHCKACVGKFCRRDLMGLQVFMHPGAKFLRDGYLKNGGAMKQTLPGHHVYFKAPGPEFYKRWLRLN